MRHHVPVLANEVKRLAGEYKRAVDFTGGDGGHTALLADIGLDVLVIDRDEDAICDLQERFADNNRVSVRHGRFGSPEVLDAVSRLRPDFCLLDLGVSSRQLDLDERGFSFREGIPLDMRMDPGHGPSAADWIGDASQAELKSAFQDFGDERRAGALARELVRRRERQPVAKSDDLVNAIRAVLGPRSGPSDFARLFQAVRIAVNDEVGELARTLPAIRDALSPGGMMVVLTYHSGEDRTVKHSFREWARSCHCPPGYPICLCSGPQGRVVVKKPIVPLDSEIAANPRARSAKLRAFRVFDAA